MALSLALSVCAELISGCVYIVNLTELLKPEIVCLLCGLCVDTSFFYTEEKKVSSTIPYYDMLRH